MPSKPKYSIEKVRHIINEKNFELISKEYLGRLSKIILKDNIDYFYYTTLDTLLSSRIPSKFHISNPYTIQNIALWLVLHNKNFELISSKYFGINENLNWKCSKDNCGEYFKMSLSCIVLQNYNCPYCSGHRVGISNCLATKNTELAKQWHPTKNGDLTPYDVTISSFKKVWWQCKNNPDHEWKTEVSSRSKGNGCPYCAKMIPSKDYNLLIYDSELCKEWNYNKNKNNPEDYTPNSGQNVWWICSDCRHEWEATISHRRNGTGCPECNKSKGEKECKRVLTFEGLIEIDKHIYNGLSEIDKFKYTYFIPQKEFDGLVGLGNKNLSYDFYIPKLNLLIEYQGNYHDGTAKGQTKKDFEKQLEHDRRKREYAQIHNIKLLEIWYWDFDRIEEILEKEL